MFCTATRSAVVSFSGKGGYGTRFALQPGLQCLILCKGRVLNMFCAATWFAVVSFSGKGGY